MAIARAAMPSSTSEGLRRSFLGLALPSIAASLLVPLSGLVDTAILGHLDEVEPLAGVALGGIVFDYLYWSLGFLRMGTTGVTAQAYGREDGPEIRALLLRTVILACSFAALILLFHRAIANLSFAVLNGDAAVESAGLDYYNARIWGAPAVLVNFCIAGWLLGLQRPKRLLLLSAVGNSTNIALDYIFIVRWGWGPAGAGWATMASQYSVLLSGLPLVRREWTQRAQAASHGEIFQLEAYLPLLRLGRDIWLRTLALISAFALFTNFSASFSSLMLAANAVLLRVLGLASYFIDGFAHATESLAGSFIARSDRQSLRRVLGMAMRWGLGTGGLFALAFIAFPALFTLLTDQEQLLAAVTESRWWLGIVLLLGAAAYILDGYFIGLAAGPILAQAMLVSFGLGFLPLALWARYGDGGPMHLWLALVLFMGARVATLAAKIPQSLRS